MSPYVMSLLADEKLRDMHAEADRSRLLALVERRRRVRLGDAVRGFVSAVTPARGRRAAVPSGCA